MRNMTKHFFIEGPSGCGKSTAITSELYDLLPYSGGFCTCRLIDNKGNACGFRHVKPPEFSGLTERYEPGLPGIFIESPGEEFVFHPEVFRTDSIDMLRDAPEKRLYIIDEIGGVEMQIPEFTDALKYRLNSKIPCIGVWKAETNSENMKQKLKTGRGYAKAYSSFRDFLLGHSNVTLLSLYNSNGKALSQVLRSWREENGLY